MSLLYTVQHSIVHLQSRSEGKIKSYESCADIRAWSHDLRKRDVYLKEWIRSDMPLCLVPVSSLIRFFSAMSCRAKGRVTPRCHPDCRSKAILDSITSACEHMRECIKDDPIVQKFVCEEELETSHWPYEKCLEALKHIKMFWRIILEKLFAINLRKEECLDQKTKSDCDSVQDVARNWERDMVHQVKFVKTISRQLLRAIEKRRALCDDVPIEGDSLTSKNEGKKDSTHFLYSKDKKRCRRCGLRKKSCTFVDACCGDNLEDDPTTDNLRKDNECLKLEVVKLKQENMLLRGKLQNLSRSCSFHNPPHREHGLPCQDANAKLPRPFESCLEDSSSEKSSVKDINSELIITMKNSHNESFRHVSMLQVLHKTNCCSYFQEDFGGPRFQTEDPIKLLTKVQTTLQAMVRREMSLAAADNQGAETNTTVEASFQRAKVDRPSQGGYIS